MKIIFYSIFLEILSFAFLLIILMISSGIFGLFSRILKILIRREADKIDKAFLGLFTIIALIFAIMFDINVFLKASSIISSERSLFSWVLQYFIYQVSLSFLLGILIQSLKIVTGTFIYCSGGVDKMVDENSWLYTLTIPTFVLALSHSLPTLAIIVYIFKIIFF